MSYTVPNTSKGDAAMRISTLRLAVLSSLAILSFSGAARAQSLETFPVWQSEPATAVPVASQAAQRVVVAAPAVATPAVVRTQPSIVGSTDFVKPALPNTYKLQKGQQWTCQLPPNQGYALCSVKEWQNGIRVHVTQPLYYTYSGELIGYAPPAQSQAVAVATREPTTGEQIAVAQQNGTYAGGLKHDPQREMLVKRTSDGGVYAAEYDGTKPSFLKQVFGLSALILTEGLSERIAYGSNGYYGSGGSYGGHNPATNYYNPNDRCGYPPGYTGPMYPLSCH